MRLPTLTPRAAASGPRVGFVPLLAAGIAGAIAVWAMAGCTPTFSVEAPKEPITINLNVKIEHEVRVKVDRELDALIADNPELF